MSSKCKMCTAEYKKNWKSKNIEKVMDKNKQWRDANRDNIKLALKEWYLLNKDKPDVVLKRKIANHLYYIENRKKITERSRVYVGSNLCTVRSYRNKYDKQRKTKDPMFKLSKNLRSRLSHAITGKRKIGSHVELLGCSVEQLKTHLESKFTEEMSWDNYGKNGWQIDHIKPLALFDLSRSDQISEACHYTNLQPLSIEDHKIKTIQDMLLIKPSLQQRLEL